MTDFEKAIHSVALTFIQTTLSYFNFGASFCNWITPFQFNALSCVQGRHLSNVFRLGRGCRQGYFISPYLFYFVRELKLKKMKILQEFKLTTPNINYHNMQIKNQ